MLIARVAVDWTVGREINRLRSRLWQEGHSGWVLKRLISLPTVQSTATRAMSMRAAKKRDKAQASERVIEQKKYEEAHND